MVLKPGYTLESLGELFKNMSMAGGKREEKGE
jgi:hypothetical protein